MTLTRRDLEDLEHAKRLLENPGLAARMSATLGSPVEKGMKMLPARWQKTVHTATETALLKALDVAIRSLGKGRRRASSDRMHKLAAAASGAAGGAFGIAAIGLELPFSTTVILRSIADIAAAEGEDPDDIETRLACLTVFALGSTRDARDNAAESGYFAARSALATAVSEAARYLAEKGLSKGSAPALVRLIGAAGGAIINTLFIAHYQDMARGHFMVRRLEKRHGAEVVRAAYEKLPRQPRKSL